MLFPTTCIDNFFDNPKAVKELAYSLEYSSDPAGNFPGTRTKPLHVVAPEYNDFFNRKLFSLFYDFKEHQINWDVQSYFQLIEPYGEDEELNVGWVHRDNATVLAGVVYLNEDASLASGTSLFNPKHIGAIAINSADKQNFYKLNNKISKAEYIEKRNENNNLFTETVTVGNVYNRLVCYDGATYHRANNFNSGTNEPRLTQVFFVNKVVADWFPIPSMRFV
jgi:hypothetical protein